MSDKRKFWVLLALLVVSIAWLLIARHYASSSFLQNLQNL